MGIVSFAKTRRTVACALLTGVCAGLAVGACTDGDSPASPSSRSRFSLGLRPQFNVFGGQSQSVVPINFVRMVARDSASGVVLGTFEGVLAEDAPSWDLGVDVTIPDGDPPRVIVTIELINVTGGVETVQWSGVTEPIEVQPGSETSPTTPIDIFQGPPSNLGVTRVTIAERAVTLVEGDSIRLHATAETTLPLAPHVFWSTLDGAVAAVSDDGTVRPLRDGTARIVAEAGPRADTVTITSRQRPSAVLFTTDTLRATSLGQELTFTARVVDPRGATVAGSGLTWRSLNDSTALSLGDGKFRTLRSGTVGVLAIVASDTILRGRGGIVTAQVPATITLDTAQRSFGAIGDTATAIATVRDSRGIAIPGAAVVWSTTNAAVANVSASGRVSAIANGQCDVTATMGALTASVRVTVQQQPSTLEVTQTSLSFTTLTRTAQLTAIARDQRGNVMSVSPQWTTSDGSIAGVSTAGLVTAVGTGNALVTARIGTLSATSAVSIRQVVASLALGPSTLSLLPSDSSRLVVAATDSAGVIVPGPIALVWSSSAPAVATVNQTGNVRAVAAGSALVSAQIDGITATATVTVRAANLLVAAISTGVTQASEGDVVPVAVRVRNNGNANAAPASLTLVTLNASNGATLATVTVPQPAVAAGTDTTVVVNVTIPRGAGWPDSVDFDATADAGAVITESFETDNRLRGARLRITMLTSTVTLQPDSSELASLGAQTTLVAVLRNGGGAVIARPITWTSLQPSIASVTQAGVVTAVAGGTSRIVALSDGRADTAVVVVRQRVADVTIAGARTLNFKGATLGLTAAAVDANGHPVQGPRMWRSITPAIVSVDSAGNVAALAVGAGRIEVTMDGVADTASIPVQQVRASLALTPATRVLSIGDTATIVPLVRDSGSAIIPGAAPTWQSSAPTIASVSSSGLVQASSPGGATITATLGALTATAAITVSAPDIGVISFTVSPLSAVAGAPLTGILTVGNSGGSPAVAAPVTLRVLDAATGVLLRDTTMGGIPLLAGQNVAVPIAAALPASVPWPDSVRFQIVVNSDHSVPDPNVANDTMSSAVVRVRFPVASIALMMRDSSLESVGDTVTVMNLLRDVHGRLLTGRVVTFTSRTPGVATVNSSGLVTTAGNGDSWIVVGSESASDSVLVHVQQAPASVAVTPSTIVFHAIGRTAAAGAVVMDARGHVMTGVPVTWTSGDTLVARVNGAGTVTSIGAGAAVVTASVAGHTASTAVTVAPIAATISIGEHGSEMHVGDTLTLHATAADSNGVALASPAIVWTSSRPTVATVSNTGVVIALQPDTVTITAAFGSIITGTQITVISNAPALIAPDAPSLLEGVVGHTLGDTIGVIVTDARGNPVPNVAVEWRLLGLGIEGGSGPYVMSWMAELPRFAVDTTFTNANGRAKIAWTLGTRAGNQRMRARALALPDSVVFEARARADAPSRGVKNRGGLEAAVSLTLQDVVEIQLFDQYDNPVPDQAIVWSVVGGPGSGSRLPGGATTDTTVTDTNGKASIDWSGFDTHVGLHQLRASVNGTAISIDIGKRTKAAHPNRGAKLAGGLEATVSTALRDTVEIQLFDAFDNPVSGQVVDWSLSGGSKLPNNDSTYQSVTDSLGRSRIAWTSFGTTASLHRLRAAVAGTPIDLNFEKRTKPARPHHGSKLAGGLEAVVSTTLRDTVEIQLFDEFNNPAAGETVDWSLTGGSKLPNNDSTYQTVTDSLGRTRIAWTSFGTRVSVHRLHASVAGTPVDLQIEKRTKAARPNHGSKLAGGLEATVSTTLRDTVEIQLFDEFDNPVSGETIHWSLSGNSKLPNNDTTYQSVTDSLGRSRIAWTNFGTSVSLHRLQATVAGTPVELNFAKQTKAAGPHHANKNAGGLDAVVSTTLTDTVEIQVFDEFGNTVAGEHVDWTLSGSSKLPNDSSSYRTTTDSTGRTRIGWKNFSTTVSLHQLNATIAGSPVNLTIPKQTKHAALKHLHLSPDSIALTAIDSTFEFTAAPTDEFGNAIVGAMDSLTWAAALDTIASIDNPKSGKGQAKKNGKTRILVTGRYLGVTVQDSVAVVVAQELTGESGPITGDATKVIGVNFDLSATGNDAKGNPIRWEWTIVSGSAAFNGSSRGPSVTLHGTALGQLVIRAKDPKGTTTKEFTIQIVQVPQ